MIPVAEFELSLKFRECDSNSARTFSYCASCAFRTKSSRLAGLPYRPVSALPNSLRLANVDDEDRWYCAADGFFHSVSSSLDDSIRLSVSMVGMSGPALVSELKPHAPPRSLCALSYQ